MDQSCPLNKPDLSGIEVLFLSPEKRVKDYQEAVVLAREEAGRRFDEYMLVSCYDRDRDFESPPNTTESQDDCQ